MTEMPVTEQKAETSEETVEKPGFWGRVGSFFKSVGQGLAGSVVEFVSVIPFLRQWKGCNEVGSTLLEKAGHNLKRCMGGRNMAYGVASVVGGVAVAPLTSVADVGKQVEKGVIAIRDGQYVAGSAGLTVGVVKAAVLSNPVSGLVQAGGRQIVKQYGDTAIDFAYKKVADSAVSATFRGVGGLKARLSENGENITNDGQDAPVLEGGAQMAARRVIKDIVGR